MKKAHYFIAIIIILTSCSTPFTAIKATNLKPYSYKNVLFVADNYHSDKSSIKKFFDGDLKNFETISRINNKMIDRLREKLRSENKSITTYFVQNNLDKETELVLNKDASNRDEDIQQHIENIILDSNIDLVITVSALDIQRTYKHGITSGVGIFSGGNPNIGMQASTSSSNLSFTYIFTAIDTKTQLEVWKGKYEVSNADNRFTNIPSKVAKKFTLKIKEDKLF